MFRFTDLPHRLLLNRLLIGPGLDIQAVNVAAVTIVVVIAEIERAHACGTRGHGHLVWNSRCADFRTLPGYIGRLWSIADPPVYIHHCAGLEIDRVVAVGHNAACTRHHRERSLDLLFIPVILASALERYRLMSI